MLSKCVMCLDVSSQSYKVADVSKEIITLQNFQLFYLLINISEVLESSIDMKVKFM